MCNEDCIPFFMKKAQAKKKSIIVTDPQATRVFKRDGTVDIYYPDGSKSSMKINNSGKLEITPSTPAKPKAAPTKKAETTSKKKSKSTKTSVKENTKTKSEVKKAEVKKKKGTKDTAPTKKPVSN